MRTVFAALLVLGAILFLKLVDGGSQGTTYVLQTGYVQVTPSLLPAPTVNYGELSSTAQITDGFRRKKAAGYLILVNWENPLSSEERPDNMVSMDDVFSEDTVIENKDCSINRAAGEAAKEMFKAAKKQGIGRYMITSGYRSVSYQNTLFQARVAQDPDYANNPYINPVKVLPGSCSEHATGLAIDILSEDYDAADEGYADTPEGKWLEENAYKYGFILRYPKDKEHMTGVIYEPWHYRYVGVEAAAEIYERGLCLEEYVE
ncbi:MAG: M15 family metallopeptidase [Christensenellales bacterium]